MTNEPFFFSKKWQSIAVKAMLVGLFLIAVSALWRSYGNETPTVVEPTQSVSPSPEPVEPSSDPIIDLSGVSALIDPRFDLTYQEWIKVNPIAGFLDAIVNYEAYSIMDEA